MIDFARMLRLIGLRVLLIVACLWLSWAGPCLAAEPFVGLPPAPGEVGNIRRGPDGRIEPVRPIENGAGRPRGPTRQPAPARANSGRGSVGSLPAAVPSPSPSPSPSPPPPPPADAATTVDAEPRQPEATASAEPLPGWIADERSGCRVWNASPRPNENVTWSGACADGVATGPGVLQWFAEGQPTDRYEGEYRGGQENGPGRFVWASGERYEGEWRDGERSGRGVYEWQNGDRYDGEWQSGGRTGHGVYVWSTGERYEGEWLADQPLGVSARSGPGARP